MVARIAAFLPVARRNYQPQTLAKLPACQINQSLRTANPPRSEPHHTKPSIHLSTRGSGCLASPTLSIEPRPAKDRRRDGVVMLGQGLAGLYSGQRELIKGGGLTSQQHASAQEIRLHLDLLHVRSGRDERCRRSLLVVQISSLRTLQSRQSPGLADRPLRVLPSSTKAIFIIADYQTGTMNYQGFPAVGILKPDTPVNRHSPTNITNPPSSLQDDAKNAQLLKALHHSTPTGAFAWPTRFLLQAPVSRSWENQPWRCIRLPAEGVSDYESYLLNTDPIWQADQSGVNAILDILGDATLQKLTDGEISGLQPKVAVLIDGKDSNGIPQLREPQPGLTAKGLFDELCKKRYNADEPDSSGDPRFVEAERRLIYITNLDSWSILALIGTAPESLTHVLSKFIPNYIRAASSLGVSFSTEGPETFTMQFSFPFRVWRSTHNLKFDERVKRSKGRLRSTCDVTFTRPPEESHADASFKDVIYASQLSCIVTGYDHARWTAILVAETWFEDKGDDPAPDMVEQWENDREDGEMGTPGAPVFIPDPLCRCKVDVVKNPWHPRPYFARVLKTRMDQIHSEWRHVIQNLAERLNSRTTRHSKFLKRMRDCSRRSTAGPSQEEAILEFDSFEDDITGYKQLIEELVPNLQETVDSGECFMKTDVNYFPYQYDSLGEEPTCLPYLTQVRNVFNDLSLMHKRLEALRTKCDRAAEDSSRSREGLIQNRQSPHQGLNETLLSTRAIIISQPIVLAAAIFECGIISRPTGITFVITLVVIVSLLPLLVAATVWLPKIKWKSAWSYVSAVCRGPRETDPATNSTGEPPTPRLQRRQTTMTRFMDWFQFGWVGWLLGGRQYPDDHVDGFQDAQGSLTRPPTAVLAGGHQEIELVRQERR